MLTILLCSYLLVAGQASPDASTKAAIVDLDESTDWTVIASDGVTASLSRTPGVKGDALRLDFEFRQGSGFCVLRRPLALDLPANYRFALRVRGDARPNNLELKLVDPSGENVWWVNRRNFEFPRAWTELASQARHFRFAWGPSGGKPLSRIGFIEIAVAAGSGGKGWIEIDDFRFEPQPEVRPATGPTKVGVSSVREGSAAPAALADDGKLDWRSAEGDAAPTITLDFGGAREFGGLAIEWDKDDFARDYDVHVSADGSQWEPAAVVTGGNGGRDYVRLPGAEAAQLRLAIRANSRGRGVGLRSLRLLPPEFAESKNVMMQTIARDAPRGWYPAYFLGEQTPWTVVGVPGDAREALMDAHGAVEVDKLAFRIEPFLRVGEHLLTWADVEISASLEGDRLPIPTVTWRAGGLRLLITAVVEGPSGNSNLVTWYRVFNDGEDRHQVDLFLAIRPFQVLPPWQDLNVSGGTSRLASIAFDGRRVEVNGSKTVWALGGPSTFGATAFADGEIVERIASAAIPTTTTVEDPFGMASAALKYSFDLGPREARSVSLLTPLHGNEPPAIWRDVQTAPETVVGQHLSDVVGRWMRDLDAVKLHLPPSAAAIERTFMTAQAHILINRDGPAIQPGSRTYERSWMRDGALTSTALLATGHADEVREFLDWYAGYQYESGKIPCVVDARGPDPVPEHDSHGEFIYALATYYRFTKDRAFLERHLPRVVKTVEYIESLRAQRLTDEYKDGPPEKRACYGLVPESISHEGYSAKPMHSYWDDFFILRGLRDATFIVTTLDRADLATRFDKLRADFEKSLYESINLAMKTKTIDYIPGCVELGDFDATSTAIALFPCGEQHRLPQPALARTFDKYYDFFKDRRDGGLEWEAYTPYEVRLIGTFVRLGQRERAHELIDFFMKDQTPPGWNQWAEVVHRDKSAPKFIGDIPHTWVASDFVNAVRSMFVYEDEDAGALVIAAGVSREWLTAAEGVHVENFPTHYGPISYQIGGKGTTTFVQFTGPATAPPGGVILALPSDKPILTASGADATPSIINGRVVVPSTKGRVEVNYGP